MTLNIDLLDRTLDQIEADAEHWDQDTWVRLINRQSALRRQPGQTIPICDTRQCLAGTALLATGKYKIVWDGTSPMIVGKGVSSMAEMPEGFTYSTAAADELGIPLEIARKLFVDYPGEVTGDAHVFTAWVRQVLTEHCLLPVEG